MNETEQMAEAARALGLSELVPEVYRDMLQPAARKLGEGLATVAEAVSISLAPLEASVWAYKEIKQWLSLRVTRIHAERGTEEIVSPPLSIAGPLLFQLVFAREEQDLRELYASLLASAMDARQSTAHPSFVSVIQQLTPDEARLLRHLAHTNEKWPSLYASLNYDRSKEEPTIESQFRAWCEDSGVTYLDGSDAYLDNLVRLRILSKLSGNEVSYEPFEESVTNDLHEIVELTSYGRLFLTACIEKKFKGTDQQGN
jgi:hypothetical protein